MDREKVNSQDGRMDRQTEEAQQQKGKGSGVKLKTQKAADFSLGEGGSDLGRGLVRRLCSKVEAFKLAVMVGSAKCVSSRAEC